MLEITIALIRQNAQSLIILNEGHLLYQKKEYSDLSFTISEYRDFTIEAKANFNDGKIATLTINNEIKGTCGCNTSKLCAHEICLFFLIKDKLSETDLNNAKLNIDKDQNIMNTMALYIHEESINYNKYNIMPILNFNSSSFSIDLEIKNAIHSFFINVTKFLELYDLKSNYSNDKHELILEDRNFDKKSLQLINLLKYLKNNDNSIYNLETFEFIYELYKDEKIYIKENGIKNTYSFCHHKKKLELYYKNYELISKVNNFIISGKKNTFVLFHDEILVLDNDINKKLISILTLRANNDVIFKFDQKNEVLFFLNIYDGLEDYIILEKKQDIFHLKINSYISYQNNILTIKKEEILYKNNLVIDEEILLNLKTTNYNNLLSYLGFENYNLKNVELIGKFLKNEIDELQKFGEVYIEDKLRKINTISSTNFKFNLDFKQNFVDLVFNDLTYDLDDLTNIFTSFRMKNNFVKLKNGQILSLDNNLIEITDLMDNLKLSEKDLYDKINVPIYRLLQLDSVSNLVINKDKFNEFIEDIIEYDKKEIVLDSNLNNILRDYQKKAYAWLKTLSKYNLGGILADDMGLGKTIEMISLFLDSKSELRSLIVAPTSLIFNWEAEFKRFAPNLKVKVIYGPYESRITDLKNTDAKIIITSYETCRMDVEYYMEEKFNILVIDEAQFIKNPNALKTIAVKKINANTRFALTGTPIENSILDLWSIFDFCIPNYLDDKKSFIRKYQTMDQGFITSDLQAKIRPFILRREKENVLELPPKIENYAYAVMGAEQKKVYEAYLLKAKSDLKNNNYKIASILNILMCLRQFACEPKLFIENYEHENAKLDLFMEIVNESLLDGHRILVFSQFTTMFPFIEKRFKSNNIKYQILTGETPVKKRVELVDLYNQDNTIQIFLISLKAGGNGLNLTGADTVIHYDPWWNIAAMNQATDRAYRFGQEKEVHVIKLILKDSIEDKIVELQNKKKLLSNEIIKDESMLEALSKEELMELFKE